MYTRRMVHYFYDRSVARWMDVLSENKAISALNLKLSLAIVVYCKWSVPIFFWGGDKSVCGGGNKKCRQFKINRMEFLYVCRMLEYFGNLNFLWISNSLIIYISCPHKITDYSWTWFYKMFKVDILIFTMHVAYHTWQDHGWWCQESRSAWSCQGWCWSLH